MEAGRWGGDGDGEKSTAAGNLGTERHVHPPLPSWSLTVSACGWCVTNTLWFLFSFWVCRLVGFGLIPAVGWVQLYSPLPSSGTSRDGPSGGDGGWAGKQGTRPPRTVQVLLVSCSPRSHWPVQSREEEGCSAHCEVPWEEWDYSAAPGDRDSAPQGPQTRKANALQGSDQHRCRSAVKRKCFPKVGYQYQTIVGAGVGGVSTREISHSKRPLSARHVLCQHKPGSDELRNV